MKKAIKKTRRPAKTATPARRSKVAVPTTAGSSAAIDAALNATDTANDNSAPSIFQESLEASVARAQGRHDGIVIQTERMDTAVVCSFIASYHAGNHHSNNFDPWVVEKSTMDALMHVLNRAGYSAQGRRDTDGGLNEKSTVRHAA